MDQLKPLIRHLLDNHLESIVSQSLLHCHVTGLHSIMLLQSPERTIRMYITDTQHELWRNYPSDFGSHPLSLGFHPHHCNLTLHVIKGTILNWQVTEGMVGFLADKYAWQSPISPSLTGGFALMERGVKLYTVGLTILKELEAIHMMASDIHTVAVRRGEIAAWLVYEGREDPLYGPYTWSNADLESFSTDGLYLKPTQDDVISLLHVAGLI